MTGESIRERLEDINQRLMKNPGVYRPFVLGIRLEEYGWEPNASSLWSDGTKSGHIYEKRLGGYLIVFTDIFELSDRDRRDFTVDELPEETVAMVEEELESIEIIMDNIETQYPEQLEGVGIDG